MLLPLQRGLPRGASVLRDRTSVVVIIAIVLLMIPTVQRDGTSGQPLMVSITIGSDRQLSPSVGVVGAE
jgi:hypothetical protein